MLLAWFNAAVAPCHLLLPHTIHRAEVVPGLFELHPQHKAATFPNCLPNFRMPADQLLRHLQALPDWQQLPVMTDADITASATRLGLLPAVSLQTRGVCAETVLVVCVWLGPVV